MPNYQSWIGADKRHRTRRDQLDPRPTSVGVLIAEKPAVIVVVRTGVADLAAQTVRIDVFGSSSSERQIGMGSGYADVQRTLILGYRNHPTEDDTDLQEDDRFEYDGAVFRVVKIEPGFTDRLLAVAEAET